MPLSPETISRLKSQLITSGLNRKDPPLFQVINQLIDIVTGNSDSINSITGGGGGGGGISGGSFLTVDDDTATLANSRQLLEGSGIQFNDAQDGRRFISSILPGVMDGQDGIDGIDGVPGIKGIQGNAGINGISGIDGNDGEDGIIGPIGPRGIQGIQGSQGSSGMNGIDGIDGDDNPPIKIGNQGISFKRGSIIFSDGMNLAENNANLFWDIANNRTGFGTNTPSERVELFGDAVRMVFKFPTNTSFSQFLFYESATQTSLIGAIGSNFVTTNRRNNLELQTLNGGAISFWTGTGGSTEKLRLLLSGVLNFFDTGVSALEPNSAGVYADDVGGTVELFAVNEAGVSSRLTGYPGFLAYNSASDLLQVSGSTIDFDTEVYDETNNFSGDTFTAPVTGRYLFTANVGTSTGSVATQSRSITLVTSNRNFPFMQVTAVLTTDIVLLSGSVIADMDAGDTAIVILLLSSGSVTITGNSPNSSTYFSGRLML